MPKPVITSHGTTRTIGLRVPHPVYQEIIRVIGTEYSSVGEYLRALIRNDIALRRGSYTAATQPTGENFE